VISALTSWMACARSAGGGDILDLVRKVILVGTRGGKPAINWPGALLMGALFAVGMIVAGFALDWLLSSLTPEGRSASSIILAAPVAAIMFVYLIVKRARKQPLKDLPKLD
jgi:hypothetical protein